MPKPTQTTPNPNPLPFPPTIWVNDLLTADDFFDEALAKGEINRACYLRYMVHRSAIRKLVQEVLDEWQAALEAEWGLPVEEPGG